jgi:hypothetical protein
MSSETTSLISSSNLDCLGMVHSESSDEIVVVDDIEMVLFLLHEFNEFILLKYQLLKLLSS